MKPVCTFYSGPLEIYAEICCDLCNEIIHNHLDCPACGMNYAPSEQYGCIDTRVDGFYEIQCEACKSVFRTPDSPYGSTNWTLIPTT